MNPRYQKVKRAERSRLLSEMEEVTGLYRKSMLLCWLLSISIPESGSKQLYRKPLRHLLFHKL